MTDLPYHRICGQFYNRPLWLLPSTAETISSFLLSRVERAAGGGRGGETDKGQTSQWFPGTQKADGSIETHSPRASRFYGDYPRDAETGRPLPYRRTDEGTAIITIVGELVNRGGYVGASSGVVSYEGIKFQVLQASADARTKNIILDIESPGGEAVGAFEVAELIRQVAAIKPVIAVVNGLAASAGYAIASGASRIVTMPTGLVGSIGVVMMHLDWSQYLEDAGVKPTFIFAGAHKVDGNMYEPLPESVRARLQADVMSFYDQFVETVAAGRTNMTVKQIRGTEALVYKGQAAVDIGLADEVGTFEEVLAELSAGSMSRFPTSVRRSSTAAVAQPPQVQSAAIVPSVAEGDRENLPMPEAAGILSTLGAPEMTVKSGEPGASVPGTQTTAQPAAAPPAAAAPSAAKTETSADLAAAFPALVAQIRTEAATAERERILAIEGIAVAGHDDLIKACKADGKTTVEQAAMKILTAEKQTRTSQLAAIKGVETEGGKVPASPAASAPGETTTKATTPEGWKAEYEAQDPAGEKLRGEFPTVESYVACMKAEASGRVRRLVPRSATS